MTNGAVISLTALEFEGDDLLVLVLFDDLGLDGSPSDAGQAKVDLVPIHDEQDVIESGFGAGFDIEFLDTQNVSLGDAVLFAAGLDDCVGHGKSLEKGE